MGEEKQYWVKLHFEAYEGATGNNVGLFDVEATGFASTLYASIDRLCDGLAEAAQYTLGGLLSVQNVAWATADAQLAAEVEKLGL